MLALLLVAAPFAAGPARADWPSSRAWTLMSTCPDARQLRAELERVADSMRAGTPQEAGEAYYWLGISERRAGLAERAIAHFAHATELRGASEDRLALADAWLARARPEDLESVAALMRRSAAGSGLEEATRFDARLGWAMFLAGRADSAMQVFRPILLTLERDPVWRERFGRAAAATHRGDARLAIQWLYPVAIATRGADRNAIEALRAAMAEEPDTHSLDLDRLLRGSLARVEAAERAAVEALGGRLLRRTASDGFPISAAWFAGPRRQPVAVVLLSSGDSLSGCDSLVATLRRAGLAALLVERRGSRGAAGPGGALRSDFDGREAALESRVALDGLEALRAVARRSPLDTTRVVFAGVRDAAPTAVLAATLTPRARGLLLISPNPAPTDFGTTCARIARLQRPMFIQLAPEDYEIAGIADALYQSGQRATSFVADSRAPGRGIEQYRGDPSIAPRFARWVAYALKTPSPPATRRSAPRRE